MIKSSIDVSVVIPLFNEEDSLVELHGELTEVLSRTDKSYEIIFVDDGSTDTSFDVLNQCFENDDHVEVIKFRRNFGKAAALQAGIDIALGKLIFTMDADLQDRPSEIPRFLEALGEGFDVISGWKKKRHDPLGKTLPSRLFNWVTRKVSGVEINDFNCGFKVYRREVFDHVELYGELHRYIPVLASWKGFSVSEIVVEHRAREHGRSKYGPERMIKGMLDLLTIYITRKYERRPLHVFGFLGLFFMILGSSALIYLVSLWFLGAGPIGNRPLLFISIFAITFGGQLMFFGLLAEILVKFDSHFSKDFVISERLIRQSAESPMET